MNHGHAGHMASNENESKMAHGKYYQKLLIMVVLSFISMYALMYAMADKLANVYPNVNQFYMAGLMTMPMIIIEVLLMRSMYMNKKFNTVILAVSVVLLAGFYFAIRQQAGVSDRQFLRGMIPHHSAALLMASKAPSSDPEIQKLQQEIISSQEKEIAQMKAILERLKNEGK